MTISYFMLKFIDFSVWLQKRIDHLRLYYERSSYSRSHLMKLFQTIHLVQWSSSFQEKHETSPKTSRSNWLISISSNTSGLFGGWKCWDEINDGLSLGPILICWSAIYEHKSLSINREAEWLKKKPDIEFVNSYNLKSNTTQAVTDVVSHDLFRFLKPFSSKKNFSLIRNNSNEHWIYKIVFRIGRIWKKNIFLFVFVDIFVVQFNPVWNHHDTSMIDYLLVTGHIITRSIENHVETHSEKEKRIFVSSTNRYGLIGHQWKKIDILEVEKRETIDWKSWNSMMTHAQCVFQYNWQAVCQLNSWTDMKCVEITFGHLRFFTRNFIFFSAYLKK